MAALHLATHSGYCRLERQGTGWIEAERALTFWALSCLAIDPVQPGRLYVGTSHSGIFTSEDRGGSWMRPQPNVPHLGTASILASAEGLLVGTVPAALFRRRDDGWEELT